MIEKKWNDIKIFIDIDPSYKKLVVYSEDNSFYKISININKVNFNTSIPKDGGADQIDWENNYKSFANVLFTEDINVSVVNVGKSSDSPGCPTISNKLRLDFSDTAITLNETTYITIYQYTGSGKVFDINLRHNSKNIIMKLTVDNTEVIFDLDLSKVDKLKLEKKHGFAEMIGTDSDNFSFQPHCPLFYSSSIKLEAKAVGPTIKKIEERLITLTKET